MAKIKIVKKHRGTFNRFESDRYTRFGRSWRRPRGIDCRVRRQYKGNKPLVKVGYGQNKNTKYYLPNGFKKFLIKNEKDLELLLMNNRVFAGELAKNLSAQTRAKIVKRAKELNVKLTNAKGKLTKEE